MARRVSMFSVPQTPVVTSMRQSSWKYRVRLLSRYFLYFVTGLFGLTSLALTSSLANAAHTQSLFQEVFWSFYQHNADSVSESTAAAYYGYVYESPGSQSGYCRKVRNALDSGSGKFLLDELGKRLRQFAAHRENTVSPRHYVITVPIPDGYRQYDVQTQMLHVGLLKGLSRPITVSIRDDIVARDQPDCSALLSLPASVVQDNYPLPTLFRLSFSQPLQKLSNQTLTGDTHTVNLTELDRLTQLPVDGQVIRKIKTRPVHKQTLNVDIVFSLMPRNPYHETDAQGHKNELMTHPDGVVEFSLPTHTVRIHQLDYRDGETGTLLASKSVNTENQNFSLATNVEELTAGDGPISKTNIEQLPKGLIIRDSAVLVRADDSIVAKTSASVRLSLNRLHQRLGLSAGLPDLSDAEGGILVGDLLDSQAEKYFTFSDLTQVQAISYAKLNAYQEEGYLVVTGWKQLPEDDVKQRFLTEAVPQLRQMMLTLPIDFIELREVYVRPYDRFRQGFPLLLRNTAKRLRVSDIRKPGVILEAEISADFPSYWAASTATAENFIADYYRHNPAADNKESSLKTITLASRYRLSAITAVNGKASTVLKLLRRGLYLDDDATLLLEELKLPAALR